MNKINDKKIQNLNDLMQIKYYSTFKSFYHNMNAVKRLFICL
jgi:hypothetical protein